MLSYRDLSEDERTQAIYQALALLSIEGTDSTLAEAHELAEGAFYPEENDVILFLISDDEVELLCRDMDRDAALVLHSPVEN